MAGGAEPTGAGVVESEVEGVGTPLKGGKTVVSDAEHMVRLWEGTRADTTLENIIHRRLYSELGVTYIHAEAHNGKARLSNRIHYTDGSMGFERCDRLHDAGSDRSGGGLEL